MGLTLVGSKRREGISSLSLSQRILLSTRKFLLVLLVRLLVVVLVVRLVVLVVLVLLLRLLVVLVVLVVVVLVALLVLLVLLLVLHEKWRFTLNTFNDNYCIKSC